MPSKLQGWAVILLLGGTAAYCLAEELTLTTYYPSPRGVYEELRVTGNLGVGTMDPQAKLDVAGHVTAGRFLDRDNTTYSVDPDGTSRLNLLNVDGNINALSLTTPSSAAVKTNIVPLSSEDYAGILEVLNDSRVFRYRFKAQEPFATKSHIGVIAEEAPAEITTEDRKGISYADYLGFLLAAVKAQQEEIRQLKDALKR